MHIPAASLEPSAAAPAGGAGEGGREGGWSRRGSWRGSRAPSAEHANLLRHLLSYRGVLFQGCEGVVLASKPSTNADHPTTTHARRRTGEAARGCLSGNDAVGSNARAHTLTHCSNAILHRNAHHLAFSHERVAAARKRLNAQWHVAFTEQERVCGHLGGLYDGGAQRHGVRGGRRFALWICVWQRWQQREGWREGKASVSGRVADPSLPAVNIEKRVSGVQWCVCVSE